MARFHFGKKQQPETACCKDEEATTACGCGCASEAGEISCCGGTAVRSVKVLGSGCKSCHALLEAAQTAVQALGLKVQVEYITDMEQIMAYGLMRMPGLVVNEQVVSAGKVLKSAEIQAILEKYGD